MLLREQCRTAYELYATEVNFRPHRLFQESNYYELQTGRQSAIQFACAFHAAAPEERRHAKRMEQIMHPTRSMDVTPLVYCPSYVRFAARATSPGICRSVGKVNASESEGKLKRVSVARAALLEVRPIGRGPLHCRRRKEASTRCRTGPLEPCHHPGRRPAFRRANGATHTYKCTPNLLFALGDLSVPIQFGEVATLSAKFLFCTALTDVQVRYSHPIYR